MKNLLNTTLLAMFVTTTACTHTEEETAYIAYKNEKNHYNIAIKNIDMCNGDTTAILRRFSVTKPTPNPAFDAKIAQEEIEVAEAKSGMSKNEKVKNPYSGFVL